MCFRDTLSAQHSPDAPSTVSGRAPEPPQSPPFITFSAGQALWKLYRIWQGGDGDEPLRLSLLSDGDPCGALLGDNLPREHQRLQLLLNDAAQARLQALRTSPNGLDERVLVFVTRNELAAWLFLFPAVGRGRPLTNARLQQALLRHFKSVAAITRASVEELSAVVPQKTAQAVYDHFHKENPS